MPSFPEACSAFLNKLQSDTLVATVEISSSPNNPEFFKCKIFCKSCAKSVVVSAENGRDASLKWPTNWDVHLRGHSSSRKRMSVSKNDSPYDQAQAQLSQAALPPSLLPAMHHPTYSPQNPYPQVYARHALTTPTASSPSISYTAAAMSGGVHHEQGPSRGAWDAVGSGPSGRAEGGESGRERGRVDSGHEMDMDLKRYPPPQPHSQPHSQPRRSQEYAPSPYAPVIHITPRETPGRYTPPQTPSRTTHYPPPPHPRSLSRSTSHSESTTTYPPHRSSIQTTPYLQHRSSAYQNTHESNTRSDPDYSYTRYTPPYSAPHSYTHAPLHSDTSPHYIPNTGRQRSHTYPHSTPQPELTRYPHPHQETETEMQYPAPSAHGVEGIPPSMSYAERGEEGSERRYAKGEPERREYGHKQEYGRDYQDSRRPYTANTYLPPTSQSPRIDQEVLHPYSYSSQYQRSHPHPQLPPMQIPNSHNPSLPSYNHPSHPQYHTPILAPAPPPIHAPPPTPSNPQPPSEKTLESLRHRELSDDPNISVLEPYRALCRACGEWVILHERRGDEDLDVDANGEEEGDGRGRDRGVRYSVFRWTRHWKGCPGLKGSGKGKDKERDKAKSGVKAYDKPKKDPTIAEREPTTRKSKENTETDERADPSKIYSSRPIAPIPLPSGSVRGREREDEYRLSPAHPSRILPHSPQVQSHPYPQPLPQAQPTRMRSTSDSVARGYGYPHPYPASLSSPKIPHQNSPLSQSHSSFHLVADEASTHHPRTPTSPQTHIHTRPRSYSSLTRPLLPIPAISTSHHAPHPHTLTSPRMLAQGFSERRLGDPESSGSQGHTTRYEGEEEEVERPTKKTKLNSPITLPTPASRTRLSISDLLSASNSEDTSVVVNRMEVDKDDMTAIEGPERSPRSNPITSPQTTVVATPSVVSLSISGGLEDRYSSSSLPHAKSISSPTGPTSSVIFTPTMTTSTPPAGPANLVPARWSLTFQSRQPVSHPHPNPRAQESESEEGEMDVDRKKLRSGSSSRASHGRKDLYVSLSSPSRKQTSRSSSPKTPSPKVSEGSPHSNPSPTNSNPVIYDYDALPSYASQSCTNSPSESRSRSSETSKRTVRDHHISIPTRNATTDRQHDTHSPSSNTTSAVGPPSTALKRLHSQKELEAGAVLPRTRPFYHDSDNPDDGTPPISDSISVTSPISSSHHSSGDESQRRTARW